MLNYASFCLQIFVMTPNFHIHIHGFPGRTTQILNSSCPSQAKPSQSTNWGWGLAWSASQHPPVC